MVRRRSRLWFGSVALLVVGTLAAPLAWAGPPPPPPQGDSPPPNSAPPPPAEGGGPSDSPSDPLAIDARTPDTDMTGTWKFSRSAGDNRPNYVRETDEDPFFTVNPIGYYQGVSLGGGNLPPFAPKEVGGQTAVLTWTGFERTEAGSRVFFQLSAAVEPNVTVSENQIIVELPRTSVQVRNNRRSLITRYFKTPVDEVDIRRKGKTVHATIRLRWPVEPTWAIQPGANGYQVLTFEFPDVGVKSETQTEAAVPAPPAEGEPKPETPAADSTNPFLPTT